MKFLKPCLDCGALSVGNRCPQHQAARDAVIAARHEQIRSVKKRITGQYSGSYAKRAKFVRDNAVFCHLCGGGFRLHDPWVADHVVPGSHGSDAVLKPAHKSCNESRGNKPLQ